MLRLGLCSLKALLCAMFVPQRSLCWLLCKALLLMVISTEPSRTNAVPQKLCFPDEDSEMDSDSEVVWAKSARGTWGLGHTFGDKLYFTRDIPEENWIPKKLEAPTVAKPAPKPAPKRGKLPAAKPAAASSSIPVADGQHVQLFKTMWDRKKKFYTVPVQQWGYAAN